MAEFSSEVKIIPFSDSEIYQVLSDLRNLDKIRDKIPQDKVKDFSYEEDSCSVSVDPVGSVKFNIVSREPNSLIKFEAERVPFPLNLFVELNKETDNETKLLLKVEADLNPFLKPMVSKPLQDAVNKIADMLASIPYDKAIDTENNI